MSKSPLPLQNVCGAEKQVVKKEALVKLLRWHFGYSDFRGKQLEAIQAVLSGQFHFPYLRFMVMNMVVIAFVIGFYKKN